MAAPIPAPTRHAPWRARLVLVAVLAGLVLLAACSTIGSLTGLSEDLQDAGFTDVSTNVNSSNASALVVSADAPDDTTTEEAQEQAAEVVWTRFPRRFEGLRVTIDGDRREWTYEELEDELGPRPAGLDSEGDIGDDVNQLAIYALIGLAVAAVVGLGIVGLIVFLLVRSSRRKAATRPPPRPWMPPGIPGGAGPGAAPIPPPGGWTPASAPPGPPAAGAPTPAPSAAPLPTGPPDLTKAPEAPPAPPPSTPPTGWSGPASPIPVPDAPSEPEPAGPRRRDPDARRLGRRPRGPKPDKAHTPPGWS